jgi:hypothetical protein
MDDPAVTAKQLVDLARKHIEEQQSRIARQRELIAKYERENTSNETICAAPATTGTLRFVHSGSYLNDNESQSGIGVNDR